MDDCTNSLVFPRIDLAIKRMAAGASGGHALVFCSGRHHCMPLTREMAAELAVTPSPLQWTVTPLRVMSQVWE